MKVEREGVAGHIDGDRTYYDESDDLRSIPSDTEEVSGSSKAKIEPWFNLATDMQDPKFQIGTIM